MRRNTMTILNRLAAVGTLAMVLATTTLVEARTPRRAKRTANTVQVLERGVGMPLVVDARRVRADKRAIRDTFRRQEAVVLEVSPEMLRPHDGVLTTMWETRSGFPLVVELELGEFDLRDEATRLEIYPDTLDNLFVRKGNEASPISKRALVEVMTRSERQTSYFCQRSDGNGGIIARGSIGVALDDAFIEIPVALRRDAFQEQGMQMLTVSSSKVGGSSSIQKKPKKVWVISWFSDDCKRGKKGGCANKECTVPLSELLKLAANAGLSIPEGAIASEVIDALDDAGVGFEGRCGKVEFIIPVLEFFKANCQCILHTFGDADSTSVQAL